MPTHHRGIKAEDWIEDEDMDAEKPKERFRTGPKGEKRPISSLSSLVRAMEVATGQREEEYLDGRKPPPKEEGADTLITLAC